MEEKEIQTPSISDDTTEAAILDEVLEKAPPEHRRIIEQMMISSVQMKAEMSPETEVMKKITTDHISSFLSSSKEEMERSYKDRNWQRLFTALMVILAMAFVIVIIVLLKDNPDVMEKVIYAGGGLVAGALGGYGFGKNRSDD